jgi:hypothetical protein
LSVTREVAAMIPVVKHATESAKSTSQWWRWLLVLPSAIAAYLLIVLPIAQITEVWFLPAAAQDVLSQLVHSLLGPWAFVYVGARVAPHSHFLTALSLTVLNGMLVAAVITAALMRQFPWQQILYVLATSVAGVVVTLFVTYGFHRDAHHESNVPELLDEPQSR